MSSSSHVGLRRPDVSAAGYPRDVIMSAGALEAKYSHDVTDRARR